MSTAATQAGILQFGALCFFCLPRPESQFALSFAAVPGFRYTIERADRLDTATRIPWLGPLFATTARIGVSDPDIANTTRFYRIRTE